MKHIALAVWFASSFLQPAVGQQPTAPPVWSKAAQLELAQAIAVEEQEKDLTKAEQLYRAARMDPLRSAEAQRLATFRLAQVLDKLGKGDEAKQLRVAAGGGSLEPGTNGRQDPERDKELRLRARELLAESLKGSASEQLLEQLTWIGAPAVPEVIAHLQAARSDEAIRSGYAHNGRLITFLWRQGGEQASRFLTEIAIDPYLGESAAFYPNARKDLDINSPEARAYLDQDDWSKARTFLQQIRWQLDAAELLTLAGRGNARITAFALQTLPSTSMDKQQLERAHAICRDGLAGTHPDLAKAAAEFLASSQSQQSVVGLLMLLGTLPDLERQRIAVQSIHLPNAKSPNERQFSKDEAMQLLAAVRVCMAKLHPQVSYGKAEQWLSYLVIMLMGPGGSAAEQVALAMWGLGYPMSSAFFDHVTSDNGIELLSRLGKLDSSARTRLLEGFGDLKLPRTALPMLREVLDDAPVYNHHLNGADLWRIYWIASNTGEDEAGDWLLAERQRLVARMAEGKNNEELRIERASGQIAQALVKLGQHNQSERVRDAMVAVLQNSDNLPVEPNAQAAVLLALLSMTDARGLDYVVDPVAGSPVIQHPYADAKTAQSTSAIWYLIYDNPTPPHGFSTQQVVDFIRVHKDQLRKQNQLSSTHALENFTNFSRIPDEVLTTLATHVLGTTNDMSWSRRLLLRLQQRLTDGEDTEILGKGFVALLGVGSTRSEWQTHQTPLVWARYHKELTALIDGDSQAWAIQAINILTGTGMAFDAAAALHNKHADVRDWVLAFAVEGSCKLNPDEVVPMLRDPDTNVRRTAASYLGSVVHKAAVPGLIELLRDPDQQVRQQATEALTRIRFYHEQEAHWDRVLKGLDASPASAAEKLLVQAKPGANQQQRLLAIQSLGVLGVPEALPFLIDWSQAADADIAAAAKQAITQIHLNPRK